MISSRRNKIYRYLKYAHSKRPALEPSRAERRPTAASLSCWLRSCCWLRSDAVYEAAAARCWRPQVSSQTISHRARRKPGQQPTATTTKTKTRRANEREHNFAAAAAAAGTSSEVCPPTSRAPGSRPTRIVFRSHLLAPELWRAGGRARAPARDMCWARRGDRPKVIRRSHSHSGERSKRRKKVPAGVPIVGRRPRRITGARAIART